MSTLFGHLSLKFATQPENLATEALFYILSNSKNARNGLQKFISNIDNRISNIYSFHTQVHETDNAIPDLVGFDEDDKPICIIEAKFWAGLTDNQPLTYLKRLPSNTPSVLLFIAPMKRMDSLADELFQRLEKKYKISDTKKNTDLISAKLNAYHMMAISSWRALLNIILTELDVSGDITYKSDMMQLQGLCDQMDSVAFLPLQCHEISPTIGKRNADFGNLIDEIITKGVSKKWFSTQGGRLRVTTGPNHYGRYFMLGPFICDLLFDNHYWATLQNTPFWLEIYGKVWNKSDEKNKVRKALSELEIQYPRKMFIDSDYGNPLIPLKVEFGVGKDKVIDSIIEQIKEIIKLLSKKYI